MVDKSFVLNYLKKQLATNRHIIGVATGSGLTAKYAEQGGADFLLALSSGYFRQKGLSSLAAYLPASNSNHIVMHLGTRELLPRVKKTPVIFGLMATDPTIQLEKYLLEIKNNGFAGINNYPTVGLIDGEFREALEEQDITYEKEVESIALASSLGLFTVAFVFNKEQAIQMIDAGADVICLHLGLTAGGNLGSKQILSLQTAIKHINDVFTEVNNRKLSVIKMVYGGPINTPVDVQFIYNSTTIDGYIGGSVFERIPAEQLVLQVTKSFKHINEGEYEKLIKQINNGFNQSDDYIDFVKRYVTLHYKDALTLNELAEILHLSRTYLSTLFKQKVGMTFTEYVIEYRINRAIEIWKETKMPFTALAEVVGYPNYSQFSKIFKKKKGYSPKEYFIKHNDN